MRAKQIIEENIIEIVDEYKKEDRRGLIIR
jgi:hypothetical protein